MAASGPGALRGAPRAVYRWMVGGFARAAQADPLAVEALRPLRHLPGGEGGVQGEGNLWLLTGTSNPVLSRDQPVGRGIQLLELTALIQLVTGSPTRVVDK